MGDDRIKEVPASGERAGDVRPIVVRCLIRTTPRRDNDLAVTEACREATVRVLSGELV